MAGTTAEIMVTARLCVKNVVQVDTTVVLGISAKSGMASISVVLRRGTWS